MNAPEQSALEVVPAAAVVLPVGQFWQPVEGFPPEDHVPTTHIGHPAPPKPGLHTDVKAGGGRGRRRQTHAGGQILDMDVKESRKIHRFGFQALLLRGAGVPHVTHAASTRHTRSEHRKMSLTCFQNTHACTAACAHLARSPLCSLISRLHIHGACPTYPSQ